MRWFTPQKEVDLCGHATLATAFVLAKLGLMNGPGGGASLSFSTRSGTLTAYQSGSHFVLDFPALVPKLTEAPEGLLKALGIDFEAVVAVARSKFDYLVQVDSETRVRQLAPDFARLARTECRGVIVTAPSSNPAVDFVSRFFAPCVGVNEDPVTGSAHCVLAPYWADRFGKSRMNGFQASPRGGSVGVELRGNRVLLSGAAVLFAQGELDLP